MASFLVTTTESGDPIAINPDLVRSIKQLGTGDGVYCLVAFDKDHHTSIKGTLNALVSELRTPSLGTVG